MIATTHPNYIATKEELEIFSGHAAGVCYMAGSFSDLVQEPEEKTEKRIGLTKGNGHHSVFGHETINLYLEEIPKALAMVLNNEKEYTTSEKSARYTKMIMTDDEKKVYDKWCGIFESLIREKYQEKFPEFFSDNKIKKLAQENARYLISVFTPTSMIYSTSYRQLNVLYALFQKEIQRDNQNDFYNMLKPYMIEFCDLIRNTPYFDETLANVGRLRHLSLINPYKYEMQQIFSDTYQTSYKASFAMLAQAQRHRTISYNIQLPDVAEYYIPPIIKDNDDLIGQWLEDISKVKFPQGQLIRINECGSLDNFILKMYERRCSCAQLEINEQTTKTYQEYTTALTNNHHPRADEMKQFSKGARCTYPDFECTSKCMFADGIIEKRFI